MLAEIFEDVAEMAGAATRAEQAFKPMPARTRRRGVAPLTTIRAAVRAPSE